MTNREIAMEIANKYGNPVSDKHYDWRLNDDIEKALHDKDRAAAARAAAGVKP